MKFKTLYAKSSNGKIKQWSIETKGNIMIESWGYVDGKIQSQQREVESKNIGRSNETTPAKQAELEAKAKWTKKIDEQYCEDKDNIVESGDQKILLPMLALKFQDRKHNITYPCMIQPKLDGVRMIGQNNKCISRQGKEFTTLEHIQKELKELGLTAPDGEIYQHGATFQDLIRKVKKDRGTTTDELEYWIYDIVSDKPFSERTSTIEAAFKNNKGTHLKRVETYLVDSEKEIHEWHDKFIQEGYEGIIIRNMTGGYTCKHRSENLQKLKQFEDMEVKIIGGKEAEGPDKGTVVFTCETKEGKVFSVRPRGTRAIRAQYLKDLKDLIGKDLTIRYQGFSEELVPRFPVGICIRDYEI